MYIEVSKNYSISSAEFELSIKDDFEISRKHVLALFKYKHNS